MRTLIFQSYRRSDIPSFISDCLTGVFDWSAGQDYDYRLIGDEIFDHVPDDLRARCFGHIPKVTDLGRLYLAREYLVEGYDRVIWLDADVFVFAPDRFLIDPDLTHGFGREIWVQLDKKGKWRAYRHVHNAICLFTKGNPVLEFLIHTSEQIIRQQTGPTAPQLIGPKLLSALHNISNFPLIESAGMMSPPVMRDVLAGGGEALECQSRAEAEPLAAVNLSSSLLGKTLDGVEATEDLFRACCRALLDRSA